MIKLLKQLIQSSSAPLNGLVGGPTCNAADVPTLLGSGSFSLLACMCCSCSFLLFLSSMVSSQEIAKNNSLGLVKGKNSNKLLSFIKGLMSVI